MRERISIAEIYRPVIQGEGAVIGKPTVFVRTGGCDYRCSWCDSKFAVLPEYRDTWKRMTPEEVFKEVRHLVMLLMEWQRSRRGGGVFRVLGLFALVLLIVFIGF